MDVNVSSFSGSIVLTRLRTAANGPVVRIYLTTAGVFTLRSDDAAPVRRVLRHRRNVSFRESYDLQNDPWRLVNLLNDGNPANPDVRSRTPRPGAARCALDRGNGAVAREPVSMTSRASGG